MKWMIAVVGVLGLASRAHADAKKDQAAVAALEAAYAATAKASGAARTTQACADEKSIEKAAKALPEKAPGGSVLDNVSWDALASQLGYVLNDLVEVCAASDKKLTHLGAKSETADEVVTRLDQSVRAAIDGGKPRDLPADLKKVGTTIAATKANAAACAQQKSIEKLAGAVTTPANADATKWKAGLDVVTAALDDLKKSACGSPRGASEEISGAIDQLRQGYAKLALAIPPR